MEGRDAGRQYRNGGVEGSLMLDEIMTTEGRMGSLMQHVERQNGRGRSTILTQQ